MGQPSMSGMGMSKHYKAGRTPGNSRAVARHLNRTGGEERTMRQRKKERMFGSVQELFSSAGRKR